MRAGKMRQIGRQAAPAQACRVTASQHAAGVTAILRAARGAGMQTKLRINAPGDRFEQEADRIAEQVMRLPDSGVNVVPGEAAATQHASRGAAGIQRQCAACAEEEETLQTKSKGVSPAKVTPGIQHGVQSLLGGGRPLSGTEQGFFGGRMGADFSQVRVHHDEQAAGLADAINARAFTLGHDVVFAAGEYAPGSASGRRLLAHELTHVLQQQGGVSASSGAQVPEIQRTLNDGHDLSSPRFSRLLDLEAAYDDEEIIGYSGSAPGHGSEGRGVQAIQQALYDLGYSLPQFGADGLFGVRTRSAVMAFQRDHPPLAVDGKVGPETMAALDARFPAPTLPATAVRSARWDVDSPVYSCVRSILCPWSPHTVDVLRNRITLKSFDSISWADERWTGTDWVVDPFPGGGYNTGTEIGVLNSSCEEMSETLYHEVLHAEQPRTHQTTSQKESYAYRIGEEFSIAMGLGGRSSLRSTDVQGREFADPAKVESFVATAYPSVPSGGGGDEIIGKAATHGHVEVQRPNGSIYTRPAAVGEKVPGPMTTVPAGGTTHPSASWTCP